MLDRIRCLLGHDWGSWSLTGRCTQKRACNRCDELEARELPHAWTEWESSVPNSCKQARTCQSCNNKEFRDLPHQLDHCQCSRCGEIEHTWEFLQKKTEFIEEAFKDGSYRNMYAPVSEYSCKVCGAQKKEQGKAYAA